MSTLTFVSYTIDLKTGETSIPTLVTIGVDDQQVAAELAAVLERPIAVLDEAECT